MATNSTFDAAALSRDPQEALRQFRQQYDRAPTAAEVATWQGTAGSSASGTSSVDLGSLSRDPQEARRQFQQQYGRAPTAQEISSWQGLGSSATRTPAATPNTIQQGFGNRSQWNTIQRLALGPTNFDKTPGLQRITMQNIGQTTADTNAALGKMEASVDRLSAANASMLRGEIPADVSAAVRRAASETSIRGGVFGSSAKALSARDLGLTSLDIKQKGIANESALLESRNQLAAARENIRQFNLTRNTSLANLANEARRNNLTAIDVERQRIAANIEANVNIMSQIAQLASNQQTAAVTAASNKIDPADIIASFDNIIEQFSSRLT